MNVIVTGGRGFIGHNLCLHLQKISFGKIFVIDDGSSGSNKLDGVEYYDTNLNDAVVTRLLITDIKPTVIFHLAAIPRVSFSVENPVATFDANVKGTLNILETMRDCQAKFRWKCRLINSSSSSIYGGADVLPTPESHPADPKSPYALQKWQAEEWCRMYSALYGLDTVTLRYFNVIGPFSKFGGAYSTVLSAWMYHLYVNPESKPFLEGDGSQTRDFCSVDNVVSANYLAATAPYDFKFHGEAFNIAQSQSHSLSECKDLLEKISGKVLDLELRPPRIGDIKHTLADIYAARNVLGYKPETDFEKQVRVMANWYEHDYPADSPQ